MKTLHVNKKNLILSLSLVISMAMAVTAEVSAGPSIQLNERERLDKNCAQVKIPEQAEIYSLYDGVSAKVDVSWSVGDQENHVDLPIKPAQNCNVRNKTILQKIRLDFESQESDACEDFRAMISGNSPVPVKNGQQGNIEAAKEYVKKYCQQS